jgi:hypothetical protein
LSFRFENPWLQRWICSESHRARVNAFNLSKSLPGLMPAPPADSFFIHLCLRSASAEPNEIFPLSLQTSTRVQADTKNGKLRYPKWAPCVKRAKWALEYLPNLVDSKVSLVTNFMPGFENLPLKLISYPLFKHHAPKTL